MKISNKKLLALTFVPLAAIFLSGCGNQVSQNSPPSADFGPNSLPASQDSQPQTKQPQDQTNAAERVATPDPQAQLEPLPTDDKEAIDTELSNIDKDIKSTDNTYKSTDLSNVNLGL